MKKQQFEGYQLSLFEDWGLDSSCPSSSSKDVVGASDVQACQVKDAGEQERALVMNLMPIIFSHDNFRRAYKKVKQNKGVAGIDGIPTGDFASWYVCQGGNLLEELFNGTYFPEAVKYVEIPKPNGGVRMLGIPTVKDRIIQQAIAQVMNDIYEPLFSSQSYGFRPKRNAHQALSQACEYAESGRIVVVDMDLKTFFDVVNHDRLMSRLSDNIGDKSLLRLIRRYLQSGIMKDGVVSQRTEGTPQGSPLSPLLSNIVLDELDKELERRGHCFVRYADDCNIFVRSQEAGERVMESISDFIEGKLKLIVNKEKSKVCLCCDTKFLGHTIQPSGFLTISPSSQKRFKNKIRQITKRNRGKSFKHIVEELKPVLRGWLQYYKNAQCYRWLKETDGWIRRKLRCYRLKQCKRVNTLRLFLENNGIEKGRSWWLALSGAGHWKKSGSYQAQQAMNWKWFVKEGHFSLEKNYLRLNNLEKPPRARACGVV